MASQLRRLTRAEVKEHNNSRSAWVIIDDNVYDVTKFLDEVYTFYQNLETFINNMYMNVY